MKGRKLVKDKHQLCFLSLKIYLFFSLSLSFSYKFISLVNLRNLQRKAMFLLRTGKLIDV